MSQTILKDHWIELVMVMGSVFIFLYTLFRLAAVVEYGYVDNLPDITEQLQEVQIDQNITGS